jgi:hypothetical protein
VNGQIVLRQAAAAPMFAQRDDLGRDRDRGLLGRARPKVEADRRVDPCQLRGGDSGPPQGVDSIGVRAPAAHRTDVSGRRLQRDLQQRNIEFHIVGENDQRRSFVDGRAVQEFVEIASASLMP